MIGEKLARGFFMRGVHDIGGLPGGPIDKSQHAVTLSEKRVDAIMTLLGDDKRRLMRVDELRRGIESLGEDAYNSLSYYERWIAAITNALVEKGVLTRDEIDRRIAEIEARKQAGA